MFTSKSSPSDTHLPVSGSLWNPGLHMHTFDPTHRAFGPQPYLHCELVALEDGRETHLPVSGSGMNPGWQAHRLCPMQMPCGPQSYLQSPDCVGTVGVDTGMHLPVSGSTLYPDPHCDEPGLVGTHRPL